MKKITFLFLLIPFISFASEMKTIGQKGDPSEVDRVIIVKMYDNYFEPKEINIKKNETIRFIINNYGEFVHEFNIATKEMHLKHQPEMMKMIEKGILQPNKIDKK